MQGALGHVAHQVLLQVVRGVVRVSFDHKGARQVAIALVLEQLEERFGETEMRHVVILTQQQNRFIPPSQLLESGQRCGRHIPQHAVGGRLFGGSLEPSHVIRKVLCVFTTGVVNDERVARATRNA